MSPSLRTILPLALLAPFAAAHFTVSSPPPTGPFNEDTESTSPCGGVTIDFSKDNVTDFHVGGESIALFLGHPQANWLFRATTDQTAGGNWTQLYPFVMQSGLGNYCQNGVMAPQAWVGQKGIVGVVANAPDGLLYQCAAVNFVSGTGATPSGCSNSTGVSSSFTSDASLAALVSSAANGSGNSTGSSTASSTSAGASSTSTGKSAAAGVAVPIGMGVFASVATVVAMGCLGSALL